MKEPFDGNHPYYHVETWPRNMRPLKHREYNFIESSLESELALFSLATDEGSRSCVLDQDSK